MNLTELDKLIELCGKDIYSFCLKLTGQRADADDLYQETFLKALEKLNKIEIHQKPKSYLVAIAVGIFKNNRKKYAIRERIAPTEQFKEQTVETIKSDELTPEEKMLQNELKQEIGKIADSLSDKLKIPLYMYYTAQMSVEEIACALKIPTGTVKGRLYKARKAMKKGLEGSRYEIF